jgi:hypothetical protein
MKLKTLAFIAASSAMSVSAYAQTEYNLDVLNTANLSYTSGTDARTATSNVVTFKVDRKVIFSLSGTGADQTVTPGETSTASYILSNSSNAAIDYEISVPTASNVTYIIDVNNDGLIDAGDTRITSTDSAATIALSTADGATPTQTIFVEIVTAADAVDGSSTAYSLQATAVEPATGNLAGTTPGDDIAPTLASIEWDPAAVQTIVDNSATDADNQGILRTETGTFTVGAAVITLNKAVAVIEDPITGPLDAANNVYPKAIPGAIVEYTLTIYNTGSVAATGITLTDEVQAPFDLTDTYTELFYDDTGTAIVPGNIAVSDNEITISNIEVIADTDTSDNTTDAVSGEIIPNSTDGKTVVKFTVTLP